VPARVVVVTGTGTGIGKTHFAEALLRRWGEDAPVCGLKPIETGAGGGDGEDARRLRAVSTFHVKHRTPPYRFAPPVSPHLAAHRANVTIQAEPVLQAVTEVAHLAEGVVVELAGGLFSPLAPALLNADLARALAPAPIVLVAPDRLGVLHDIGATTRAARSAGVQLSGIVLMAPEEPDASTGTNAAELKLVSDLPLLATFERAPADELATSPAMTFAYQHLTSRRG
jgi:dethiobiotin synthetase